jgi:hypothetical protein
MKGEGGDDNMVNGDNGVDFARTWNSTPNW